MFTLQRWLASASLFLLTVLLLPPAHSAGGLARKPVAGPRVSAYANPYDLSISIWGNNSSRQLGPVAAATTTSSSSTYTVNARGFVRSMALGDKHGIMALDDGSVQVWGGVDAYTASSAGAPDPTPRLVAYQLFRSARQVAAGNNASYVLMQGGTLYSFGVNNLGQLGNGTIGSSSATPIPVAGIGGVVFVDSKCDTAAAIDESGQLWTWGQNANGQLGIGAAGGANGTPSMVLTDVVNVAVGCDFIVALQRTGQVLAWGGNIYGQLGQNNTVPRSSPTQISVANIVSLGAGYYHALAVASDGRIATWGRNSEGQLGLASTTNQLSPAYVPIVTTAMSVAGGDYHSVAILQNKQDDTEYWAAGFNDLGQLGPFGTVGTSSPSFISVNSVISNPPTIRRTGLRNFGGGDLFWSNASTGQNGYWVAEATPTPTYQTIRNILPGWVAIGTGDINFDDLTEVFFYNSATGDVYFWSPEGSISAPGLPVQIADEGLIGSVNPATGWRPQQIGDLDGDGSADILWRNIYTGNVAIWYLTADGRVAKTTEYPAVGLEWQIVKTGDFDGNGVDDILWRNSNTGQVNIWFKSVLRNQVLDLSIDTPSTAWVPQVVADLDGDGRSDIFWRNTSTGQTFIWYMKGNGYYGALGPSVTNLQWNAVASYFGAADAGQSGVIWRNSGSGEVWFWRLDNRPTGSTFTLYSEGSLGFVGSAWQIAQ